MLFVGVDWAEDHHDVCCMDEEGRVVGRRRIGDSLAGARELHALVGEHVSDVDTSESVVVGIEKDRGLMVRALVAAGYHVVAVNPMASALPRTPPRLGRQVRPR